MGFKTTIGLEVHIELSTKTKIFCNCPNSFGKKPNSLTCPICMGLPGTLPSINGKAVEYGVKTALALNSSINELTIMDRKNYFYPDLPKAYQISQLYRPLATGGGLYISTKDKQKFIRIHELHIEEDAGKLIHDVSSGKTYVDYNRCGVPLIEIVTKPDLEDAEEVVAFLDLLRRTLIFIGVSDCKIEEGSMRVDVNLSVGEEEGPLGTRTETKNLSSFKAVMNAIEYESKRQISVLSSGGKVNMETRRFDENSLVTVAMRPKEECYQYKYFPEPDIMPIHITEDYINRVKASLPDLPSEIKRRLIKEDGLPEYDADILTSEPYLSELYLITREQTSNPKESSNWILSEFMRIDKAKSGRETFCKESLGKIINMVLEGRINRQSGKEVLENVFTSGESPEAVVSRNNLEIITDEKVIRARIREVLMANEKAVEEYKSGISKSFGYLMGTSMRALDNKADPSVVRLILTNELN